MLSNSQAGITGLEVKVKEFHSQLPSINPENGEWDQHALSRSGFLQFGFWVASGLAGLTVGGASAQFLVGHSLATSEGQWTEVGMVTHLPPGQMHRVVFQLQSKDLWRNYEHRGVLFVFSQDGANYTVLDGTCTHLGCNVRWIEESTQFSCPCHHGIYSQEGDVIEGPPPKPLRRLETRLENGVLMALA